MADLRYAGTKLTGLSGLKKKLKGMPVKTAIITCSGTSFKGYDDSWAPKSWPRFAVNETIKEMQGADYWVLADSEIAHQYSKHCPEETTVLAMRQATTLVGHRKRYLQNHVVYSVDSMNNVKQRWDNGYQFFSRGTVMIGAIEMARWLGFTRFFVFGLDCFRTKAGYYYDGRKPQHASEWKTIEIERVRGQHKNGDIWVTSRLKRMIQKLDEVKGAGLWNDIEVYCVNSPDSQQTVVPKMTVEEFKAKVEVFRKEEERARESSNRGRSANVDDRGQRGLDDSGGREVHLPKKPRRGRPPGSGKKRNRPMQSNATPDPDAASVRGDRDAPGKGGGGDNQVPE